MTAGGGQTAPVRPEERVAASFTDEADEDPLNGVP